MRTKADVRQRLWFYGFQALGHHIPHAVMAANFNLVTGGSTTLKG
jgi:hypothetical protein